MKVLMFGWEFPPHITGGLGTACLGLTRGLIHQGVQVIFVVPKAYGDESKEVRIVNASDITLDFRTENSRENLKKLTYIEVGSNLVPYLSSEEFTKITEDLIKDKTSFDSSIFTERFTFSGRYGKELMREVARYALVAGRIATEHDFDVIHAHDWLTYPAGIAAKKISTKPLVIHVHATEYDRSGENINQAVYNIEKMGMQEADRIITVSNLTRQIVIERYGIDASKVFTVYNAIDTVIYDFDAVKKRVPEKVVTFLGRVTFQKGPDYFVEAAYRVLQVDPNVRFVMAGSGDMLNRMIKRVAQLGIATKFHFTGFLAGDEVHRMFALSDVYVMPSVSEPFGISPLEAMQSNVPTIISKQSGVAEILKHALKVDFWDIDAIADSIYGLLHYGALSRTFSNFGKNEVENLKWDNAGFEVSKIYSQIS